MLPKLYSSLAEWWPLLSPPSEYREEAEIYRKHLQAGGDRGPLRTLLELGCGGGNNASFLKQYFHVTLTDLSPAMLAQSQQLNPECEHIQGDMRIIRLGRTFDCVFIHDAICYMTNIPDLRKVLETAFVHCRPGGVALFAPDCVRETFSPGTDHGGSDGVGRSMRYLEWTWDPDPSDSSYMVDYVYALRDADGGLRIETDRHVEGVFGREEWLGLLREVGFRPRNETVRHSEVDYNLDLFIGLKPR